MPVLVLLLGVLLSASVGSAQQDPSPRERLATHGAPKVFLQIQDGQPDADTIRAAARFHLLVLDAEAPAWAPEYFGPAGLIRTEHPDAVVVAYFSAADVLPASVGLDTVNGRFIGQLRDAWFMKDVRGDRFGLFEVTPGVWSWMLNLTTRVNGNMPAYLGRELLADGSVDGIFYDWINDTVAWLNDRDPAPDIDNDGRAEPDAELDRRWQRGTRKLLRKSHRRFPDGTLVVGNGGGVTRGTYGALVDGLMIENFVGGIDNISWGWMMALDEELLRRCAVPGLSMIMANGKRRQFVLQRFTLASALMLDGYYTFTNDFDVDPAYVGTWWYDEYAVDPATGRASEELEYLGWLGAPRGPAHAIDDAATLLSRVLRNDPNAADRRAWRRDYANGVAVVNPTRQRVRVALGERLRKIRGTVDPAFNDGGRLSVLILGPQEGAVLVRAR